MNEFKYPIYKKHKSGLHLIVKFIGERTGTVVSTDPRHLRFKLRYGNDNWMPHTYTKVWQDLTPLELASIKQKEKELKL